MSRRLLPILAVSLTSCSPDVPEVAQPRVDRTVATVDLEIGAVEGEDPYIFTRISGLLADSEGRILVADAQTSEIRVFNADGSFLFRLNREGSGPGELAAPCCLAWSPEGHLWARDGGNHRYNGYEVGDASGRFLAQTEMSHSDPNFWSETTFDAQGRLVDVGHRTGSGGRETVRFHVGTSGLVEAEDVISAATPEQIGQHAVTNGPVTRFVYQPFAPRQIITHGPEGRWAEVLTSSYEVRVRPEETVLRIPIDGPILSEDEIERGRERLVDAAERIGSRVGALPFDLPERKPPIRTVFFDADGQIWVERNVSDGSPRLADVWDASGTLIRKVQWPADVDLALPGWVGTESALGVRRDALGVNYVVRLRY